MSDLIIPTLRIPARRRIGGSHTTFIYDRGILMSGIFSAITRVTSTISGIESAEVLRERLAFVLDQMREIEKVAIESEEKISEQEKRIHELERELARYRASEQYVEHRGALFKRKPGGGYADIVYCPKCQSSLGSLDPQMAFRCRPCEWRTSFLSGELGSVLRELGDE